ncbi:unnamed protein product [Cladocopium goreaui]|uniref:Ammonium transporter 1 member 1 n=1 Tax=Cladocopium goreaui TaxID=2562237 RepID=A0A9P1DPL2_9DINO|nr:unnamed protein product [Cladocopium goreaui]
MKKPASRNVRGRSPACSVCKSLGHRIEKCPHPAAKEILKLRKENSVLKKQSKRKVLRQEKKWRKAPKLDKEYRKKASALYKGKPAARLPSPAEIRRKQKHALDVSLNLPTTENTAASWLLDRQWIRSPTVCSECDRHVFSDLVWSQDRPPHWRCKHCGVRVKIYDLSIFTGLRVSPCELVKLIGLYVSSNLAHYPSVPDFVQASTHGRSCVEHFLAALRMLESTAGKNFSQTCPLRGSVEVDGSFIAKFHMSANNLWHADQIQKTNQSCQRKGQRLPKSFVGHIMVLGAQVRGNSSAAIYVPRPHVTAVEQRPVTETLAQVEASGFLDRITRRSVVNADGNKAWKSAAASRGLPFQNVIHQVKNFTSDCPKVWPEVSTVAGTQTLDRSWRSLKTFLPKGTTVKQKIQGHSCMHPSVPQYMYMWAWRQSLGNVSPNEFLEHLEDLLPQD